MENEQANAPSGPRITPGDIQRQEFGVSRFGGYRMRDVDEFLDRLTESTELILAENERLRAGGSPIVGIADPADVDRHADEILERARAEAARIVEEARSDRAPAPVGPVGEQQRAAVDAFLSQERAFLQSLATLVQGHAESVKAMARRARSAPAQPDATETEEMPAGRAEADISLPEAEDDEAAHDEQAGERVAPRPDARRTGEETVVLEEPQPTSMGGERDPDGDPSLKQLFWGGEDR